jgi:phospholipase A1
VSGRHHRAAGVGAALLWAAAAAAQTATPLLDQRWDLDGHGRADEYFPRPYKPTYLLPATHTDNLNIRPSSPSPGRSATEDQLLRKVEAKYQLSFKSKLGGDLLGTPLSLWGGYTQSSRWQVYNGAVSRPFRETNYEPELIAVLPLNQPLLGGTLRMVSLAANHQSNGRSLPLSRSWNRWIAGVGWERGEWTAEFRPWWRMPEAAAEDDNPDIRDHVGRAELLLARHWEGHALHLQLRHSLRRGERSRGSAQLEWAFPLRGALHGWLQVFSGYGESLVDYNQRQNKIGLGVTIAGWR